MAQVNERLMVDLGVYCFVPVFGVCPRCFKIGTPLRMCRECNKAVRPTASLHSNRGSFFINAGFMSYVMRHEEGDEEDKYDRSRWCTEVARGPRIEEVRRNVLVVANDAQFEQTVMERARHPAVMKILRYDYRHWTEEDTTWLQDIAKRSVLDSHRMHDLEWQRKNHQDQARPDKEEEE